jgi:hypothetical protein
MTRRMLAASNDHVLEYEYETVFAYWRVNGQLKIVGDHLGDPACGVIAPDGSWFAVGGEGVSVFTRSGEANTFLRHPLFHVSAMKLDGNDSVRILVDPSSDNASVWRLAPATRDLVKLRDGPGLRDEPLQENVPY